MSTGTVNETGRSQKGAPKLKIDGRWYFAGRCNVDGISAGDSVEFEGAAFGKDQRGNDLWGLNKIRPLPKAAANGTNKGAVSDDAEMRFISNVVGSALTGGKCESPDDVAAWALGAQRALKALKEPDEPEYTGGAPSRGSDEPPPFDDEIPF